MFTKTLKFSDIKSSPETFSEMNDSDVFQIIHRGSEVKVLITQEHYFGLMAKIEQLKGNSKRTPFRSDFYEDVSPKRTTKE